MNNEINLYIKDTIRLANTITVKSSITAAVMNNFVKTAYGSQYVDENNLKSWKYYKNISGEYHFSDTKMYVTSLDTLEEIEFNKENLEEHSLTKENYLFGTRYYYSLLEKYPEQETLIKSILYPCDIDVAINAVDGTILSYQKDLVEEQEQTLIWELNKWCQRYQVRWKVDAFMYSDTLYPATQLGIMYLNMVNRIMNLRLKRCKTREAHSFHIKMFLASHNKLHEYLPYYTLKQKLWLYRNICYLEHNAGIKFNFEDLVDKLLTDRLIPLSEFTINHVDNFDNELYTDYKFDKERVNIYLNVPDQTEWTLQEIYDKENTLLVENETYNESVYDTTDIDIKNSPSSTIQTKLLESKILDYGNSEIHSLPDTIMNYWPYMAAIGKFNAVIEFTDPKTNSLYSLSAENAFIFWIIITCKKYGINLKTIPNWLCIRVLIPTKPSIEEIQDICYPDRLNRSDIKTILSKTPFLNNCNTVKQFNDLMTKIFNRDNDEWWYASNTGELWANASLLNSYNRSKQDTFVNFSSTGMEVSEWLKKYNIELDEEYTNAEYDYLLEAIFESATGYVEDETINPGNIQTAMIETLKKLSSYSIQFIKDINENDIMMLNWKSVRLTNASYGITEGDSNLTLFNFRTLNTDASRSETITLELERVIGSKYGNVFKVIDRINNGETVDIEKEYTDYLNQTSSIGVGGNTSGSSGSSSGSSGSGSGSGTGGSGTSGGSSSGSGSGSGSSGSSSTGSGSTSTTNTGNGAGSISGYDWGLSENAFIKDGSISINNNDIAIDITLDSLVKVTSDHASEVKYISRVNAFISKDKQSAEAGISNISSTKGLSQEYLLKLLKLFNNIKE